MLAGKQPDGSRPERVTRAPKPLASFVKALCRPHPPASPESFSASLAKVRAESSRRLHRKRSRTRWVPNPRLRIRRTDWSGSSRPFCSRRWADPPRPCMCPRSHALATTTSRVSSLTLGPSFGPWSRSLRSCGVGKADLAADVLSPRHSAPQTRDDTVLRCGEVLPGSHENGTGPTRSRPNAARQSMRERIVDGLKAIPTEPSWRMAVGSPSKAIAQYPNGTQTGHEPGETASASGRRRVPSGTAPSHCFRS
jgi:hypothetical protein